MHARKDGVSCRRRAKGDPACISPGGGPARERAGPVPTAFPDDGLPDDPDDIDSYLKDHQYQRQEEEFSARLNFLLG